MPKGTCDASKLTCGTQKVYEKANGRDMRVFCGTRRVFAKADDYYLASNHIAESEWGARTLVS